MTESAETPLPLWSPSDARRAASRVEALRQRHGAANYDELWDWSVDPEGASEFWAEVAQDFAVPFSTPPSQTRRLNPERVSGIEWFPNARLNYAEMALRGRAGDARAALIGHDDERGRVSLSGSELVDLVGSLQRGLLERGVGPGETVAGYLPNVPETVALMLATVGLGATWTCCAPEMGPDGVLDRLVQSAPRVLVVADGYRYADHRRDMVEDAATVRQGLTGLAHAVRLNILATATWADWEEWDELCGKPGEVHFEPVPFDHPLYVLYSSGTTGRPKAIVHAHGGITLEHVKALGYHFDLDEDDTLFWYSTTGWMMWNFAVSGLLLGATVALFDGHPGAPPGRLWDFMAEEKVTVGGLGAAYIVANAKAQLRPGATWDLSRLTTLGATGSPLPGDAARWVYENVKEDLMLASFSGGTDVCSGFVGTSALHDVYPGEISCRCLGADVRVYDESGSSVLNQEGELVIASALPSMPVRFLDDPGDVRYHASYFERFEGVWAHGDRATLTDRGTVLITGRSDGTLNRGGVRMGTAEFYNIVEALDDVADSMVVHLEDPEGGSGELWLFLVAPDVDDEEALVAHVRATLRSRLSPRHVPDHVVCVASIPRTLSGKKMEVPIKKILAGAEASEVVTISAMANPESLTAFEALARPRA